MSTCSVEGCDIKASVRGMCWGHDKQAKRGVTFHPVIPRKHKIGSQVPWLYERINYDGDACLTWPFALYRDGRGQVTINKRTLQAHRVMCELAHGAPPSPVHEAAHSCGKGHEGCVNPRHLSWKTSKENKADMLIHGTRVRGSKAPWAVVSEAQVYFIREFAKDFTYKQIAYLFDLKERHIGKIVRRESWGHI